MSKSPPRPKYAPPVPKFVQIVDELMPGRAYSIEQMPPTPFLKNWSSTLHESSRIFVSRDHFTHTYGPYSETYQVATETDKITGEVTDLIEKLRYTQEAVKRLIGRKHKRYDNPGWTFSRLANVVVDWLQMHQLCTQRELLIEPDKWNYQRSIPKLKNSNVLAYPHAFLYDIRGAYWQFWQRVKNPFVYVRDGNVEYGSMAVEDGRKWARMHKVLDDPKLKRLHNSIVGTNARGWRGKNADKEIEAQTDVYQRGEVMKTTINPGPLMPLSLLTVRCVYEIVQIQSEMSRSIYSNIDCVVTEFPGPMRYWDECNIRYRMAAAGPAIIRRPGSRLVGEDVTEQFLADQEYNLYMHLEGKRYESPQLHRSVLFGTG